MVSIIKSTLLTYSFPFLSPLFVSFLFPCSVSLLCSLALFPFLHGYIYILSKVKDTQLSCIVNRDLTRRVKCGSEMSWSKRVLLEDVQLLLRVIHVLDKKAELWEHASTVDRNSTDEETPVVLEQPKKVCFYNVINLTF